MGKLHKNRGKIENGNINTRYLRESVGVFMDDYAMEHGNWATGRPDSPINLPVICNAFHGRSRAIPLKAFTFVVVRSWVRRGKYCRAELFLCTIVVDKTTNR